MAVLGRVLFSSAERVDLPDLLSLDSFAAGDWSYFLKSLIGTTRPYVLSGFDVIDPEDAISLSTCSIRVADSVVYYPGSSAGPFFYGLAEGNPNAVPLVPELRTNATNYVYLTLTTFDTASDTRALWDPDRNGGEGGEFTQDINTESVIQAQVNVSTGSFPVNTVPIAIITVGPTVITSIQDARDMMFRLGTGGLNPDPASTFGFQDLPSSQYARQEPSTVISSLSDPNPFQGGDKNIATLKQWMDVVMTKLKELGGTAYWYEDTATFTIANLFHDALTTTWKSKGSYTHASATPGELSWSEDIYIKDTSSPKDVVIRASGGSPLDLDNEQIAYINLIRDAEINTLDQPVAWTNGQAYVNTIGGSVGRFQNLQKGDWIKKVDDENIFWLQVREFYNTTQSPGPVSGSVTSAANARSIILSDNYLGTTSQAVGDRSRYDRGEYLATDINIVDRDDSDITDAAGNFLWFASRSDTVMAISSISSVTVSGTVTSADGTIVTVGATAHGLLDGDRITVTTPAAQAGTYTVDIVDANIFTFKSANTTTGAFVGFYGLATTMASSVDGFQTESANHGLESGETVQIEDTTNYNAAYLVSVRSSTVFQFPRGSAVAAETSGTMVLARMDVRSEEGINKLVQGETVDIGSGTIDNMQAFIGMSSPAETYPVYVIPGGYGTFNGGANYNSSITDSLTARTSKLTAMMMDKAQDKTVKYLTSAIEANNFVSGANRSVWFSPPSSTLTILQPGSAGNATVSLPSVGSPIALAVNQSAYVTINRNAASAPGLVIASNSAVPVGENVFVIATRLADEYIYLWDSETVLNTVPLNPSDVPLVQVTYHDPLSTVLPTGSVTIDDETVTAGDTCLFSALTSNANMVYEAVGVGTAISSWTALYKFHGLQAPVNGDTVIILTGTGFALQVGKFDGSDWLFNDKVRYFNGVDYWEQSNIISAALADNTTAALYTVTWPNNEHMIVDYSIVRSTARETGTLYIVTDGTTAEVSSDSAYMNGNSGTSFTASIAGSNISLNYTTTSTGQPGTMKYMVRRWASGSGGPAGIPSYSGAAGSSTGAAAPLTAIQFNSAGVLAGNANFLVDVADLSLNFNGLHQGVLSSALTLLDNQPAPTNLFSMATTYPFIVIEYSATKESFARVGQLLVAYDGTNVICNDAYAETGATGLTFQAVMSGPNIQFQYTSTNGAADGSFKYSWRKWS